jgi:hypothetical protein
MPPLSDRRHALNMAFEHDNADSSRIHHNPLGIT